MNVGELFDAGRLNEAIDAATTEVKSRPTDVSARSLLCELLCFRAELDRVDKQLEVIGQQDPSAAAGVALFRQLVRAEVARRQFFEEGRVPEVVAKPSRRLQLHLEASVYIRDGENAKAAELLAEAEQIRPVFSGTCDGKSFADFRDGDDLTSSIFEVLTTTGKYFWIPFEQVELLELRPVRRPRDVLWRAAHMIVRGGPDGEVYLPELYYGSDASDDDQYRLGRSVDWLGGDGSPCRGLGMRMFMVDDDDKTLVELSELQFNEIPVDTEDGEST